VRSSCPPSPVLHHSPVTRYRFAYPPHRRPLPLLLPFTAEPGADSDLEPILGHLRKYQTGTLGGGPGAAGNGGAGGDGGGSKAPAAGGGVVLPGDPLGKPAEAAAATPRDTAVSSVIGLPLNASVESLGGSHGSSRNAAAVVVSTSAATATPAAAPPVRASPPATTASTDASGSGAVELVSTPAVADGDGEAAGLDLTAPTDGGVAAAPPRPPAQPPVKLPAIKAAAADSERFADDDTAAAAAAACADAAPLNADGGAGGATSGADNLATGAGGRGYVVGPFEYECLTTLLLTANDIHDHELERLKIVADAVTHRRRRGEALAERLQQAEDATKHYIAALEAVEKAVDSTLETPEDLAGLVLSTPPPATIPGLLLAPVPATSPIVTIPPAGSAAAASSSVAAAAAALNAHLHHPHVPHYGSGSHFSAPPGTLAALSLAHHHVHGANPALWAAGHGGGIALGAGGGYSYAGGGGGGSGATTPTAAYSGAAAGHAPTPQHAPGTPTAALSVPGLPHTGAAQLPGAFQAGGLPHSPSIVAGFGAAGATAGVAAGQAPAAATAGTGFGAGGRSYSSAGLSLLAQQAQVQQAVAAATAAAAASASSSSSASGTALPPDAQPRLLLQQAALAAAAATAVSSSQPPRRAPSPAPPSGAPPAVTAPQQQPHSGGGGGTPAAGKDDGGAAAAAAAAQAQAQLQAAAAAAAANDAILAGLLELGRQVEAVRFEELLEWYLAETENNLSDARLLVGRFDSERKSIQLELANSRNRCVQCCAAALARVVAGRVAGEAR
jgi:trimeric autotransporter adhesin